MRDERIPLHPRIIGAEVNCVIHGFHFTEASR